MVEEQIFSLLWTEVSFRHTFSNNARTALNVNNAFDVLSSRYVSIVGLAVATLGVMGVVAYAC